VGELVVTGSRIRTTTYNSPDPLTVITAEQAELTGEVDTAQILQLSTVAANAVQINNFFTGFITTGGPGVNTLSLRGLGAQRTLFLLNGERMGPAGVGGTVGPVDLNTIPSSQIDHIDILKDGASSIYGSDAVAGVVNVITKTAQDGGDIHVFGNPSQGGGGNQYQVDASWGKTFDKGYITAGFDFYRQDALTLGQRSYLSCRQDLAFDATTGQRADIIDPATGQPKCQNILANGVVDLALGFQEYVANPAAVSGGGPQGIDVNGFQAVGLVFPGNPAATRASAGLEPSNSSLYEENTAISPVSRYTFTLFGQYDLAPHAELYGSMLLNQRDSAQNLIDQFFIVTVDNGNPGNQALGPSPIVAGANGFIFPVPVILQKAPSGQTVDYGRFVGGVKGDLPNFGSLTDWTYDVYGQYSRSDGDYVQVYSKNDRVNATAGSSSCDVNIAPLGGESMAQAEPGVACVPVNYFAAVENGGFTPAEAAFLYSSETGHTTYEQEYVEGSATGNIISLPAGPLGGAFGFELRREAIDDVPGADFINSNVYNFTTSGITKGSEEVEEAYGELQVPILKAAPLVESLNLDVSGRYSHYSSYGSNYTYKGTLDWKVTDWLAFRATYGTAFRAPALYELFLANQTSFLNQISIDPCIDYGQSTQSQTVKNNCASLGIPPNYTGNGSSAEILTGGGAGHLKPETSIAETVGIVLTPKIWDQNFNIAADYYSFDISNQIQQFGSANILEQCFSAQNFPNNPFCTLFNRDPVTHLITLVNDDYVNVAKEIDQGLDLDITWKGDINDQYKLTIESSLAWTFYTNTFLLGGSENNFLGQIGQPKFVGNIDWRVDHGPWTFNYFLYMIGPSSDNPFVGTETFNYMETGENVVSNFSVPFYSISNIAVRRKFDKFTAEFGVKNLFNQAPPALSDLDSFQSHIGLSPLVSQYDIIGRSFYFDLDAKF